MRFTSLLLVLLAVAFAHPAFADEKAKPNTLTAKEIADGWILLFDGETTFGWDIKGEFGVKDGALRLGGEKLCLADLHTSIPSLSLNVEASADGITWSEYVATCNPQGSVDRGSLPLSLTLSFSADRRLHMSVATGEVAYVRSMKARPEKMTSLFNGKDLTGWKVLSPTKDKKAASEFTVTKEGWLNVNNGPGDLQTDGQWADFIVQLECISDGPHLNSGLFFRAIPDQYQLGYEAQIHNGWKGDDRTKPTDWGTGAIYRRQAARKVVSTDKEWFTMTVAAHGKHLATWVNGYQVTDWMDDRKENDNARLGFKAGKGALSIQAHDKTTDLSFRNIRIQSLDK